LNQVTSKLNWIYAFSKDNNESFLTKHFNDIIMINMKANGERFGSNSTNLYFCTNNVLQFCWRWFIEATKITSR